MGRTYATGRDGQGFAGGSEVAPVDAPACYDACCVSRRPWPGREARMSLPETRAFLDHLAEAHDGAPVEGCAVCERAAGVSR